MQFSDIDWTKPGRYGPIYATVAAFQPIGTSGKVQWVKFKDLDRGVKSWCNAQFAQPLEIGAAAEVEIEIKSEDYNGETRTSPWLASFGGPPPDRRKGAAGNGAAGWRAKTPEEIHAAGVAEIVARVTCAAIAQEHSHPAAVCEAALRLYWKFVKGPNGSGQ